MKKYKGEILIVLGCILIIGITVTFAYFLANIEGEGKSIILKSKNLKITFTESNNLSGKNISPGWSKTSTFIVKNEGDKDYTYNIVIKDLINTFVTTGNLQYKITSTDGGYNMTDFKDIPKSSTANNKIIATNITISGNTSQTYTVLFTYNNSDDNQIDDMGKTLSGQIIVDEYIIPTLAERLSEDNPTRLERTDFSITFNETNIGILYMSTESIAEGVDQNVYYFSGNAKNNWVKFAGFYWRIIRTNADGSIRLLYSGTNPDTTEGHIGRGTFNLNSDSPKYAGYMYGDDDSTLDGIRANTNDSTIKVFIDNWYENNLITYTNYLSNDAVYCNDRKLASGNTYSTISSFQFESYERLRTNKTPTYDCANIKDAFSVNNGEAKLKYPIALMTADELVFAGGKDNTNLSLPYTWYYNNSIDGTSIIGTLYWWTMTSSSIYNVDTERSVFAWTAIGSAHPGQLNIPGINGTYGVRPVTSLKSCVQWKSGDGSASNPYEIVQNGGC